MATPTSRSSSPAPNGGGGASSETPTNHQQHDPTTVVIDNGILGSSSAAVATAAAAAAAAAGNSSASTQSVSSSHRQPIHLQQMVKSLQTALQKKTSRTKLPDHEACSSIPLFILAKTWRWINESCHVQGKTSQLFQHAETMTAALAAHPVLVTHEAVDVIIMAALLL